MALRRLNLTLCVCLVGGQFLSCNSSWTEGNTLWMSQWWACKGAEEKHSRAEEEKQQSLFMKQVIDFRAVFHTLRTICVKMCLWHVAMNNLVATEQEGAVLHALPSILSARAFIWASCNGPAEAERAEKIVSALLHSSVVPPPPCWVVSEQTSLQSKTATFYKVEKLPYFVRDFAIHGEEHKILKTPHTVSQMFWRRHYPLRTALPAFWPLYS